MTDEKIINFTVSIDNKEEYKASSPCNLQGSLDYFLRNCPRVLLLDKKFLPTIKASDNKVEFVSIESYAWASRLRLEPGESINSVIRSFGFMCKNCKKTKSR